MGSNDAPAVREALKELSSAERACHRERFFQTQPGGYGEGDRFLGATVPEQRAVSRRFRALAPPAVEELLRDPFHECRMTALCILTEQFERGDAEQRRVIVERYVANLEYVNNWDLVDTSAPKILGPALLSEYTGSGTPEFSQGHRRRLICVGWNGDGSSTGG